MARVVARQAGVALMSVLLLIALVAVLTASMLGLAGRLQTTSNLTVTDAQLDGAVAQSIAALTEEWTGLGASDLAVGASLERSLLVQGMPATLTATRLAAALYWVVATVDARNGARRRAGVVLRAATVAGDSIGAITASGAVNLGDDVTITGAADSLTCSTPVFHTALIVGDTGRYRNAVGLGWTRAVQIADTTLATNASIMSPSGLINALGNLTVTGGTGSGVLLVAGRLRLGGPLRFTGLVVAGGGIESIGHDIEIHGLLIAGPSPDSVGGRSVNFSHRVQIRASHCIAQTVVNNTVNPVVVRGRGWSELH